MVDFILLLFTLAMFAGGFWCGKTFNTYEAMLKRWKAWLSE
jgi:hypothetical protein